MDSELQSLSLDNPGLGELELDTTLRVKTREVLGFCLVISSVFQSMFLFLFFPINDCLIVFKECCR